MIVRRVLGTTPRDSGSFRLELDRHMDEYTHRAVLYPAWDKRTAQDRLLRRHRKRVVWAFDGAHRCGLRATERVDNQLYHNFTPDPRLACGLRITRRRTLHDCRRRFNDLRKEYRTGLAGI